MFTLFDYLPSRNAWKVRQIVHHLQRSHRTEIVSIFEGEGQRPDFLAINPTGAVPAIRLDDGACLPNRTRFSRSSPRIRRICRPIVSRARRSRSGCRSRGNYVEPAIGTLRHWIMTGKVARRPSELVESRRAASMKALGIPRSRARDARVRRGRCLYDRGHFAIRLREPRVRGGVAARGLRAHRRVDRARRIAARIPRRGPFPIRSTRTPSRELP